MPAPAYRLLTECPTCHGALEPVLDPECRFTHKRCVPCDRAWCVNPVRLIRLVLSPARPAPYESGLDNPGEKIVERLPV